MKRTPPTTHYSQLRYETTSPARNGKVRCYFLEEQSGLKVFLKDLLKDIWKLIKWFARLPGKKEMVIGVVFLIGFLPHVERAYAAPLPKQDTTPHYLQPIPRIEPVTAVSFAVPETVAPIVPPPSPPVAIAVVGVTGCGDNFYKQFIYQHESGCRTNAINPIGACGLGQALPCSKMGCSLSDWGCQDAFFTSYALGRYGSWAAAYSYWVGHSYW